MQMEELYQAIGVRPSPNTRIFVFQSRTEVYVDPILNTRIDEEMPMIESLAPLTFISLIILLVGFLLGTLAMMLYQRWQNSSKFTESKSCQEDSLDCADSHHSTEESDQNSHSTPIMNPVGLQGSKSVEQHIFASAESTPELNSAIMCKLSKPLNMDNTQVESPTIMITKSEYLDNELAFTLNSSEHGICDHTQVKILDITINNMVAAPGVEQEVIRLHDSGEEVNQSKAKLHFTLQREGNQFIKTETIVHETTYMEGATNGIKAKIEALLAQPTKLRSRAHTHNIECITAMSQQQESQLARKPERAHRRVSSVAPKYVRSKQRGWSDDSESNEGVERASSAKKSKFKRTDRDDESSKSQERSAVQKSSSREIKLQKEQKNQSPNITYQNSQKEFPHLNGFFNYVFDKQQMIGKGGFGEVHKAMHRLEQKYYAIKKLKLFLKEGEDIRQNKIFREVSVMLTVHHHNVVRHHTTWTEQPINAATSPLQKNNSNRQPTLQRQESEETSFRSKTIDHADISDLGFEWDLGSQQEIATAMRSISQSMQPTDNELTENEEINESILKKMKDHSMIHLFIQMEYCSENSLRDYLDNRRSEPDRLEVLSLFKQIVEGVIFIHKNNILHRDLKPPNIFLDDKNRIKIGDFGLSWLENSAEEVANEVKGRLFGCSTNNIGTPMYISPEQEKFSNYDYKTDIFSLGMILFEMLNSFRTQHERIEKMKDLRNHGVIPSDMLAKCPEESSLVLKMTESNPAERISAIQALSEIERLLSC